MILVDSRVGSKDLLKPIQDRTNCQAKHFELDSADVCFAGNGPDDQCVIGCEVKSVTDLLDSARSGRFQIQLAKMVAEYDFVYLIYHGVFRPSEEGTLLMPVRTKGSKGYNWVPLAPISRAQKDAGQRRQVVYQSSELHGLLNSCELMRNANVIRATTELDVIWNIVNLYNWWQRPFDSHTSVEVTKAATDSMWHRASVARQVAASLPGIGWPIAAKVEKVMGSVIAMANASVDEWAGVSWESATGRNMKIGHKKAEGVWKAIREDGRKAYGRQ